MSIIGLFCVFDIINVIWGIIVLFVLYWPCFFIKCLLAILIPCILSTNVQW